MKFLRIQNGHAIMPEAGSSGLLLLPLRRLQAAKLSTVLFYLFGLLMIFIWMLPSSIALIGRTEFSVWVIHTFIPVLLIAATLFSAQHLAADSGEDMVRRPLRFLAVMICATVAVHGVMWIYDTTFHLGIYRWFYETHHFPDFFRYAVFFALIGWLSCLYLQRAEGEAKFAMLSIRRSMLSRELAQSRLMAARSRIEPRMVVRVLRRMHAFYESDPDAASALMDHLIAYLRMAMNREQEKTSSFDADISIANAYFALREAETGVRIDFKANFRGRPSAMKEKPPIPIFLILQKIFESFAPDSGNGGSAAMHVDVLDASILIDLGTGAELISDAGLTNLRRHLAEMAPHAGDILHRISDSGEHWYAVEIPYENGSPHRTDR